MYISGIISNNQLRCLLGVELCCLYFHSMSNVQNGCLNIRKSTKNLPVVQVSPIQPGAQGVHRPSVC